MELNNSKTGECGLPIFVLMNHCASRSLLLSILCLTGSWGNIARAQDSLRNEQRTAIIFNIELTSRQSIFAKSLERTPHDELIVKLPGNEHNLYRGREVARVTYLSTPLEAAKDVPWDSIPIQPCQDCFCSLLEGESTFFEAHGGATFRGSAQYTIETIGGPQSLTTQSFGSTSEQGTVGAFQADAAYGWRWTRWRFGAMLGILPSDGSLFIPVAVHGAYDLETEIFGMCPNLFANAGIPFDFRTHAPIFFSDFRRTRKFLSGGIGFEHRMSASSASHSQWNWSLNLGVEYLTVPLSFVDCCPGIPNEDHYPVRSIFSTLIAFGISF